MTAFSFTTGNPNNLVANQNASMADIQGPFTDLRTFLNGGTMDETNVPNLSAAFTTYKRIEDATVHFPAATAAGTYVVPVRQYIIGTTTVQPAGSTATYISDYVMYLNPALYNANSRTTKLVLEFFVGCNATAPGVNFTAGLYPVSTWQGAVGATPAVNALGTVVTGSMVTVTAPTQANNPNAATGSDFNFPAAGAYVFGIVTSGATAANSVCHPVIQLEMRQV